MTAPAYEVRPVEKPVVASIVPPGSKSYTNRVLPLAAVADGVSTIRNALDSEDVQAMLAALRTLGVRAIHDPQSATVTVHGAGGPFAAISARLDLANSGTSLRFLAGVLAAGRGEFVLDGNARMRERPVGDLLAALRALGVDARSERDNDCPPIRIATQGFAGGEVAVRGEVSSQFLSALLMAAPLARSPMRISVSGELVSKPYIDMTLQAMADFAVRIDREGYASFAATPGRYVGRDYVVEPDASAASYWFAAAAITGGQVTVPGLGARSLQGDLGFVRSLERMGCGVEQSDDFTTVTGGPLHGIDVDMRDVSDTVPTMAAVASFANGPTTIRNIANIRVKECDRLAATATELRKLGAEVEEGADWLRIVPRPLVGTSLATYDDHRMAMALALVGLRVPGVRIENPACVGKTYPNYWQDFARLTNRPK